MKHKENEVKYMNLEIKLSSVTYALKARELLLRRNVKSKIIKNPSPKKGEGCGYVLSVYNPPFDVKGYLELNNIAVKDAVYR